MQQSDLVLAGTKSDNLQIMTTYNVIIFKHIFCIQRKQLHSVIIKFFCLAFKFIFSGY